MIPEGTKLVCPKCRSHIATFVNEVPNGKAIGIEDLEFKAGRFKRGDYPKCPFCGNMFIFAVWEGDRLLVEHFYNGEKWCVHPITPLSVYPQRDWDVIRALVSGAIYDTIKKYGFKPVEKLSPYAVMVRDEKNDS